MKKKILTLVILIGMTMSAFAQECTWKSIESKESQSWVMLQDGKEAMKVSIKSLNEEGSELKMQRLNKDFKLPTLLKMEYSDGTTAMIKPNNPSDDKPVWWIGALIAGGCRIEIQWGECGGGRVYIGCGPAAIEQVANISFAN